MLLDGVRLTWVLRGRSAAANRADTRQHPAARADANYPHKRHPKTSLDTRRHDRDLALGQQAGGVDPRSVSGRRRFADAGVPAPWMTGRHENPGGYWGVGHHTRTPAVTATVRSAGPHWAGRAA